MSQKILISIEGVDDLGDACPSDPQETWNAGTRVGHVLREIRQQLRSQHEQLLKELQMVSQQLADLQREVAETRSITQSAITLLEGLSAQIRENADDADAMRQLADELDQNQQTLAASIAANTPGGGPAPTPIEPTPPAGDEPITG